MRILVIEDETGLRDAIIDSLKQEGYLADGAEDGETGLDLIRSGLYDLVLLDRMLPVLNGLDVLYISRKLKIDVPIILVTAMSQLEDKIEGMDGSADDYITKPFEMQELMARIRMVLRRRNAQMPANTNLITVGNLVLDTSSMCISCQDSSRSMQLASKEFHMLEYLMSNEGQVLSRDKITVKVWGYESEAEYNNVDVYISYIRKKLLFLKVNVQIVAVRGIGYKLHAGDNND